MQEFYNNNISHTGNHTDCFKNCGKDTAEGLFALKQIPVSWGGFKIDTANTLRFWFSDENADPSLSIDNGGTWTKIENHPEGNVWDWTCDDTNWESKFDADNGWALNGSLDPEIKIIGAGDTSNVTNMTYMFYYCDSLTTVSLFDTSNVTNMTGVFQRCTSLTYVPLFDTGSVIDMNYMFYDCSSLTSVPLFDTSSVTNMYHMFYYCSSLTTVPLFDTSSVTNMSDMFSDCTSLTSVPLFDTKNVTDMSDMFYQCTSLTTVPLFDTSSVTNMSDMFSGCSSLTSVPLFDTSNVTNMSDMFFICYKVKSGALALYQRASVTGKVSYHGSAFTDCGKDTTTGLAELQQIPESWGGLAAG